MSSTFGEKIKMTIFGESHGPAIGLVIDGLPAGLKLDQAAIKKELDRRAPGKNSFSTARREKEEYRIESGLFEERTTGMPLCVLIPNTDAHSSDYSILKQVMRPGHGDYPGYVKYGGFNDYRGGGAFSGRLTAPLVFMGAVAKQLLAKEKISVGAHIASIGAVQDTPFNLLGEKPKLLQKLSTMTLPTLSDAAGEEMATVIQQAREAKDSVGGTIECMTCGIPVGLGEPYFDSVESRLAHVLFSVPAVKAVEFGKGFALSTMQGSSANDGFKMDKGKVKATTNNNGGILGGLTTGMPIVFKVGIKPTSSIGLPQKTINVVEKKNTVLEIQGRHDPCIVPRAIPVIEAVTAWTILDLYYMAKGS